jgi:hypothetical protein
MKITIEPYSGGEFSSKSDAEHISEVVEQFKGLLVASGYHPETVDEYFNNVNEWFGDSEVQDSEPSSDDTCYDDLKIKIQTEDLIF